MILRVKEFMNYNPTHHWFFEPSLQKFGTWCFRRMFRPRFESPSPDVTFGWSPLETGGTDPNPARNQWSAAGTLTHL